MRRISYRSQNVRETLVELKNISEIAVDLAYASVLYDYPGLAEEVIELESRADSLQYPAKISLMLAAKRSDDAEKLVGIVQIVDAAVSMTNAAADIAAIVTNEIGVPTEVRQSLPEADEVLMRAQTTEDSAVVGKSLGELSFETENGVRIIAVRRGTEWNIAPAPETRIQAGDTLVGQGPEDGVKDAQKRISGTETLTNHTREVTVESLDRAATLLMDLKNISELAVGLGYAAVLSANAELAEQVVDLERQSDRVKNEIELLAIESGGDLSDPSQLRGLLHLATASEVICDAAMRIADIVLREGEIHPVFGQAIGESDELITTTRVATTSPLAGPTLREQRLEEETGMYIMAIHRDEEWILTPTGETALVAGDLLISRGPESGVERLQQLATGK